MLYEVITKSMGFGADIKSGQEVKNIDISKNLSPEDFIHYGLIPEFVGRVPMMAHLHELDKEALIRILTEPKNSLVKQYEKIFSFESIELEFEKGALEEIAEIALQRKTGVV